MAKSSMIFANSQAIINSETITIALYFNKEFEFTTFEMQKLAHNKSPDVITPSVKNSPADLLFGSSEKVKIKPKNAPSSNQSFIE